MRVLACENVSTYVRVLLTVDCSAERRCLRPGTARLYDVSHKCAYGGVVVYTQVLAIKSRHQLNPLECFGNHPGSFYLPV